MRKNFRLLTVILNLSIFGALQLAAQTIEVKGTITGTVVDGNTRTKTTRVGYKSNVWD